MPDTLLTLIWGLGLAVALTSGLYFVWLRPMAARAKLHAEKEAELRAGTAMMEAREEALKAREKLEDEFRIKNSALAKQEEKINLKEEALGQRRDQLELRDEQIQQRRKELDDLERSIQSRADGLAKQEDKISLEEEALGVKRNHLDQRDEQFQLREKDLNERERSIQTRIEEVEVELHRVAGLTKESAEELLLARVTEEFTVIATQRAKQIEADAAIHAERLAKKTVLDVIQRSVVDYVTEATLAVVELPSEDMKGRIIGREGRNLRAFEQVTGVDLIVDETPEAVVISCFDPVRRETARLALMNLMVDGRIHPGRIEELFEKAKEEVSRMIRDAGERAAERANVPGLHAKVIEAMGRLRFRTSYAQNVLDHSVEVSRLCASFAAELGLNVELAKRAGFLHDIGKALGPEWEGPHALTGMEFLRGFDEKDSLLNAVGAHHYEIEPLSPEAMIVIIADTISAARPGARRENLENYIKRLTALETLANSFPGVERSFAVQAGREIRMIVKPEELDDLGAARLARDVAKRIESEMEYPGQIKVTVIRETRASETAK